MTSTPGIARYPLFLMLIIPAVDYRCLRNRVQYGSHAQPNLIQVHLSHFEVGKDATLACDKTARV